MKQETVMNKIFPVIILLMLLALILNSVVMARTAGYIQLPGEMDELDIAKEAGEMSVQYYEDMAEDAGVFNNSAVRDVIAQMKFELEKTGSPEEVVEIQEQYGEKIKEVIQRERDSKRSEAVVSLINKDPNADEFEESTVISISKSEGESVVIEDPDNLLSQETIEAIKEDPLMKGSWPLIEVKVEDGNAQLITARSMIDRLKMYEDEVDSLRSEIKELKTAAGYSEISGAGIIVNLHDAEDGHSSVEIVHDRDIRDVINELYAAGAKGISVGGERLIATTSIRCAGPSVLVNQKPIAVNPIVIKAVGTPEVLESSLDLIKSQLKEFGIRMEVEEKEKVVLPAYKGGN